jgi:hypothetical protein
MHPAGNRWRQPRCFVPHLNLTQKAHRNEGERYLSKALLSLCIGCFVIAGGCTTPGMHRGLLASGQAPSLQPKLLAVYMPWFGDHTHLDVGYSSDDPAVLRKQIQQARHMGISAFVVDWYGTMRSYSDHNFALLQAAASEAHFQVALLYNEPEDGDEDDSTDEAVAAMDKAYRDYIGPTAKYRETYLTYNGRPMIFVFPKNHRVNWTHVVEHCSDWQAQPLLIYENQPQKKYADGFAGSYAWVQPGAGGWAPDGSNWGKDYLEDFYKTMASHPNKITVGGAWPGFDDTAADWSLNRHIANGCGKTLDETLNFYRSYFDASHPLPFMMIETWNDYEEGTAVERRSASNCGGSKGAASSQAASR